jgi:hypothetical protein
MALFRSKLPLELRNMIWKLTLQPRIIEIQFTTKKAVYTKSKLPTALHVSQESRAAVEKLYPFRFGSVWHRPHIRFNFDLDTIFLNGDYYNDFCHFFILADPIELHQIRYLAIDNSCQYISINDETDEEDFEKLKKVIESMEALQEMSVTHSAENFFENCQWIGQENGVIQIHDTLPVLEMITMEDFKDGIQVNWQQVHDVASGPSVGKFEDWRVRSRCAVFTKREGREGRYAQEFNDEI